MKQSKMIGQYLALVFEVLAYAKLGGIASSYAGLKVPASETKPSYETTWPYSTALKGGGANRPASFGAPIQANIQSAWIAMMNQLNILGLKMNVMPDRIIAGPKYQFDLRVLLNSAWYPSVPGSAGTAGSLGAINPIQGLANLSISRFVFDNAGLADGSSKAWYLVDSSVPASIIQMRQGPVMEQEAPNAGAAFERDVVRFKGSVRGNADFVEPRFFYQGNDGSV
jgi:hypothetical protein